MAAPDTSGAGAPSARRPSVAGNLLFSVAKYDEIARLMGILELDLEEKNVLPPRKHCMHARQRGHASLIRDAKKEMRFCASSKHTYAPLIIPNRFLRQL